MRNSELRTNGTYEKQGSRKMRAVPEIFWEKEKPTAKAEHCEQQGGAKGRILTWIERLNMRKW